MLPNSDNADTSTTMKLEFEDPKVHEARMLVMFFCFSFMFNSTLIGAYYHHRDTSLDALLAFWFSLLFVAENSVVAYRQLHQGEKPTLKLIFMWLLPTYVVGAFAVWFGSNFMHVILVVFMFCLALASRLFLDFVPHIIKQDETAACCDNKKSYKWDGVRTSCGTCRATLSIFE